jgi:hypothetical protein
MVELSLQQVELLSWNLALIYKSKVTFSCEPTNPDTNALLRTEQGDKRTVISKAFIGDMKLEKL